MIRNLGVIFFLIFIAMSSCKNVENAVKVKKNDVITINVKDSYLSGEKIEIKVKNTSEGEVKLLNPDKVSITKKIGDKWEELRILRCPCGAPCQAPRDYIMLDPDTDHVYLWNQKESFCGELKNQIPETITKDVGIGIYKIQVRYMGHEEEVAVEKEFRIK